MFIDNAFIVVQGQEKFIDDCIGFLPTKTRDQIEEHEQWYRQFLSISNKRRLALKRWREERNVSVELDFPEQKSIVLWNEIVDFIFHVDSI